MSRLPEPSAQNPAPLSFLLHLAGRRTDEAMANAAGTENLSVVQAKFVRHLVGKPDGVPLAELADLAGCTRANVTQMLDRLEQSQLTERRSNPSDARSSRAVLTAEGLAMFRHVEANLMAFEKQLVAALGRDSAEKLWEALTEVVSPS